MSKKNIFMLAAWYIAGWLVASIYGKKKPNELKKEMEEAKKTGEWNFKVIADNFIDIHQSMVEDIKKEILTETNIKLFNEKKEEILEIIDVYKVKWTELIEELKIQWKDYLGKASEELEKLYNEKKNEIEWLKWVAPEKISELKTWLLASFEELKKEIKKIWK